MTVDELPIGAQAPGVERALSTLNSAPEPLVKSGAGAPIAGRASTQSTDHGDGTSKSQRPIPAMPPIRSRHTRHNTAIHPPAREIQDNDGWPSTDATNPAPRGGTVGLLGAPSSVAPSHLGSSLCPYALTRIKDSPYFDEVVTKSQ